MFWIKTIVNWLSNRKRQRTIAFIASVIAILASAVWTVFVHFSSRSSPVIDVGKSPTLIISLDQYATMLHNHNQAEKIQKALSEHLKKDEEQRKEIKRTVKSIEQKILKTQQIKKETTEKLFSVQYPSEMNPKIIDEKYRRFVSFYRDENASMTIEKAMKLIGVPTKTFGRSFALLTAVSNYPNFSVLTRDLRPAEADLSRMKEYLQNEEFFDEIVILRNHEFSYENMRYFLTDYFPRRLSKFPRSRFIFTFSGHGIKSGDVGYLLTVRAQNFQNPHGGIPLTVLSSMLEEVAVHSHHSLVLINASHSGAFPSLSAGYIGIGPPKIQFNNRGGHVIVSNKAEELAWHDPSVGPGSLFFEKILDGIRGAADVMPLKPDGLVTVEELVSYLQYEVGFITEYRQNPQARDLYRNGSKGGFIFAGLSSLRQR